MNGSPSTIRAIRGPITLVPLGVFFGLNNFSQYGFAEAWPVLLIVFGALSLLSRSTTPGAAPPPYGYPPPPPRPSDPSIQPPSGDRR